MRVLLDEGIDPRLAKALIPYGIAAEPFPNLWKGLRDGQLLSQARKHGFAALLTNDRAMGFQQNLATLKIALVALPTSRPRVIIPRAQDIAATLAGAERGDFVIMNIDGTRRLIRRGDNPALPSIASFR